MPFLEYEPSFSLDVTVNSSGGEYAQRLPVLLQYVHVQRSRLFGKAGMVKVVEPQWQDPLIVLLDIISAVFGRARKATKCFHAFLL